MSITAETSYAVPIGSVSPASPLAPVGPATVPWYIWCGAAAITSAYIGADWDVSWHRSIGRDTFWTPAHMAIYLCGVLAAIVCGYLILRTTFHPLPELRAASVRVLGFRAPLGAFLAAWGGIAMLTSAPFDNWWHAAYGLDVTIISPPHTLLILGNRLVEMGMLILVLGAMNRARRKGTQESRTFAQLRGIFLYLGGLIVGGQMFFLTEYTWDIRLHSAKPYMALAIAVPIVLAMIARASDVPWAATITASTYTVILIAEILILPLFPAAPKLGPVFFPVTHFVPFRFPVLVVVPALGLDLLWQRTRRWTLWQTAFLSGFLFVGLLVAVEWPFADFLMSPAAANRFFGTGYFDYSSVPWGADRLRHFLPVQSGGALFERLLAAAFFAAAGTWVGLLFGDWMRKVQR